MERVIKIGRILRGSANKWNPLWWFKNDDDPLPPSWYPHGTMWWYLRNPLHNLFFYVLGIADRNRTLIGPHPVEVTLLGDMGWQGWKWCVSKVGWLYFPFISYSGTRWWFYIGWRPSGALGLKLIKAQPISG